MFSRAETRFSLLKLSFQAKVLLPVIAVLIALPAAVVLLLNEHIKRDTKRGAEQTLATADSVFRNSFSIREQSLIERFRNTVREPRFKAVASLGDQATMSAFLDKLLLEFSAEVEIMLFSPASGEAFSGAYRGESGELGLFESLTVGYAASAIRGELKSGLVVANRTPYNVISLPVFGTSQSVSAGALTICVRFGDETAEEMKSLARTDVLLFNDGDLLGGTLSLGKSEYLLKVLEGKSGTFADQIYTIEIGGENFHYLTRKIGDDRAHSFNYMLLSSYQERLEDLADTKTLLLGMSSVGIGFSIAFIWILIRNITRPLRLLRDGAEAVGKGDFSRKVESQTDDECGELADAFNRMTGNLQTSRTDLEKTVTELQTTQEQLLQREARLRESEEGLRLIIEGARDHVIFTIDDNHAISRWNAAAERILGFSNSEAQRMPYAYLFEPEDYAESRHTRMLDTAKREGRVEFEGWRRRKDGTRFWADVTISRLEKLVGSEGAGYVEIARDISARKEAEEAMRKARDAAEESDRAKSEFLASMSHEVRTPMNGIIGMAGILDSQDLNEEQRDCVDTIRMSADSLLAVIDDILDISKIESGKFELAYAPTNLHELVEESVQLAVPNWLGKGISVSVDIHDSVPLNIETDAARVRQALVNLVDNAMKFTEVGNVSVSVEGGVDDGIYRIIVADTGIGIPSNKLNKLFTPFGQIDSSFSRKHGGTGLGLAITQNIANLLGGNLIVSSQEGRGSKFCFSFKAKSLQEYASAGSPRKVSERKSGGDSGSKKANDALLADSHPLKILIVEDNAINLKVLAKVLGKFGYEADTAENGQLGLEAAEAGDYDFIFMDLQMPVMDGFESARAIFESENVRSDVYICAFTANAREEDIEACKAAGMQNFGSKPARPDKIRELLEAGIAWRSERVCS
ncbi:MAG: ATP-binding protein [Verrucomicrobiota bacterium]